MEFLQTYLLEAILIFTIGINVGMMLPSKDKHTTRETYQDYHFHEKTEEVKECKQEGEECNTNKS